MRTFFVACTMVVVTSLIAGEGDAARQKKVLIIGIDGCRPDALAGAKTPHLDGLIREGAWSNAARTGDITVSGPGWTSMLSGVWREKHGVRDNNFEGANLAEYPHFFRRVKEQLPGAKTASIVQWAPINKRIVSHADIVQTFKTDREVADRAESLLREGDADVVFIHFDDVDHAGHKHGFHPDVAVYRQAIEESDARVGRLLKAMRGRKSSSQEDWLVLVSTDHGGSGKKHGQNTPEERTIFVIVSGPNSARGIIEPAPGIVDVAATALTHLGIDIDPKWKLDGKAVGLKHVPKEERKMR